MSSLNPLQGITAVNSDGEKTQALPVSSSSMGLAAAARDTDLPWGGTPVDAVLLKSLFHHSLFLQGKIHSPHSGRKT